MGSSLAWLDSSRADHQRMRELIGMFSDQGTLDELGIGQVRDAVADLLFPGTSTLHTRARYLLIVPWCYQAVERLGRPGVAVASQVETYERTVIATLKRAGATAGLVGRVSGVAVKTLPSTIYWTALAQYGIRHGDENGGGLASEFRGNLEAEELAERRVGMWHPTMPARPSGFPYELPGGLNLPEAEARWLRDRIMAGTAGSLLAHLVAHTNGRLGDSTAAPWEEPAAVTAPGDVIDDVHHAELFSLAMHGAALVYNLLIAERYEQAGFTQVEDPVDRYRAELAEWAETAGQRSPHLTAWERADLWQRATRQNPRIADNLLMRRFVDAWLDAVVSGEAHEAADDDRLRNLVSHRERLLKRAQSRLVNERMLRTWSGSSGSRRLNYRWPNVRRLVDDIHDGLTPGAANAAS